jgi:iron complex transport system substrate-binding protein
MPVNFFTSYLDGSDSKTNVVNDQGQPVTEAVVGTEPDLVIAPNITSPQAVRSLRDAGLTVYNVELAGSLDDVTDNTRTVGRLVGEFDSAADVAADTHARIEAVREAVSGADRPMAYYALGDGFTAGPETFIGDVIDSAGADNIASEADIAQYRQISQEVLAANTIDWLVLPGQAPRPTNPAINESRAVAEDNIVRVDNNFINQPAPRVVQPLATMAEAFHPEEMADVDIESIDAEPSVTCETADSSDGATTDEPTTTAAAEGGTGNSTTGATTTTAMADDGMDDTPTATTTAAGDDTESGDGPGFTAVLALVAVVAAALIAARRS